jgi:transposase
VLKGVKADKQTILKFLQANWRSKQLFLLEQGYNTHNFFQQHVNLYDQQIEAALQSFTAVTNHGTIEDAPPKNIKMKYKTYPVFNTREYL